MSITLDLMSATDLHGTVDGYRAGCRGSACSGQVTCRDVWTRYNGDYTFRRRVDAGDAPAVIVAEEIAEREAVAARDRDAARQARMDAARAARAPRPPAAPRVRKPRPPKPESKFVAAQRLRARIAELHAEGLTDRQIADRLDGQSRDTIGYHRRVLGLPVNPAPKAVPVVSASKADRRDAIRKITTLRPEVTS